MSPQLLVASGRHQPLKVTAYSTMTTVHLQCHQAVFGPAVSCVLSKKDSSVIATTEHSYVETNTGAQEQHLVVTQKIGPL